MHLSWATRSRQGRMAVDQWKCHLDRVFRASVPAHAGVQVKPVDGNSDADRVTGVAKDICDPGSGNAARQPREGHVGYVVPPFDRAPAALDRVADRDVKIGEQGRRCDSGPEHGGTTAVWEKTRSLDRDREGRMLHPSEGRHQPLADIVRHVAQEMKCQVNLSARDRSGSAWSIGHQPSKRMPHGARQVDRDEESLRHADSPADWSADRTLIRDVGVPSGPGLPRSPGQPAVGIRAPSV